MCFKRMWIDLPRRLGVLTPGPKGRLVLANTEELHERIEQLSSRNRDLEKALQKLQETVSDQPHPLLGVDPLNLNFQRGSSSSGPSTSSSSKSPSTSRISPTTHPPDPMEITVDEDQNVIEAFGTLRTSGKGESSYFGRTARAEYLAQASNRPSRSSQTTLPRLSRIVLAASEPETELYSTALLSEVLKSLPTQADAFHLCDVYLEYGKFLFAPISRKELHEEIVNLVYRARQFSSFDHYHSLSLLFIVFAIATLFSPRQQPFSTEAHEYYHLARAVLGFSPPTHETTLMSIQTLIHMAQYLELSDAEPGAQDQIWMYMGQAALLCQKMGLHLNSSRWKLSDVMIERRHEIFWRIFVSDTWKGLLFGRPPVLSVFHIDCPRPLKASADGAASFHSWDVNFAYLLRSIMESVFVPQQPIYVNILDFDRQIRDFEVPGSWRIPAGEESPTPPTDVAMYRWLVLSSKEIGELFLFDVAAWLKTALVLLNLHRAHFAQALQEAPHDLQRHRYLPSVVAVYRSAWRLLRGLAITWKCIPKFLARLNLAWSHGLSAAVRPIRTVELISSLMSLEIVLCLLVCKAPSSSLSTAALEELDNLNSLYDVASSSCRPAARLLGPVQTLRRKAHGASGLPHIRLYHQHDTSSSSSSQINGITTAELDRLNGKTTFLSDHPSSSYASGSTSTSTSSIDARSRATSVTISESAEGSYFPQSPVFHSDENLHQSLAKDLQDFAAHRPLSSSFYDEPSIATPQRTRTPQISLPSQIPIAGPSREPQEVHDPTRLFPHHQPSLFHVPPRVESLPQLQGQYFYPALQTQLHEPFVDPRRTVFGSGFQPSFQSGFSGGFAAASSISLDPSWSPFVEQLGFA
ncbi:hypothetical protein CVT26_013281 [Gymnopilus dilepis]|uniref:Xylanolytic transcriptional activator regulatory domain-containing protein n=1 Tax=Gymnopilus dilepis TaxID=231916 RepID=A0A409VUS6_9AGAR|nr:hypothetical protein CVT26_013281 [Gymnopilus dilepis]